MNKETEGMQQRDGDNALKLHVFHPSLVSLPLSLKTKTTTHVKKAVCLQSQQSINSLHSTDKRHL